MRKISVLRSNDGYIEIHPNYINDQLKYLTIVNNNSSKSKIYVGISENRAELADFILMLEQFLQPDYEYYVEDNNGDNKTN